MHAYVENIRHPKYFNTFLTAERSQEKVLWLCLKFSRLRLSLPGPINVLTKDVQRKAHDFVYKYVQRYG